jgi:hypothetical protein
MKPLQTLVNVLILALILSSCTKTTIVINKNDVAKKSSYIQLVHASPNVKGITIWLNDSTQQKIGQYYKSNAHYIQIPVGLTKVEIKLSREEKTLFSSYEEILPATKYSIYASDSQKNFSAFITIDEPLPIKENLAQLRIVNCLSTNESIDVELENAVNFSETKFKNASPYQYVEPGSKNLKIRNSTKNTNILQNILIYLDPGVVYTLYVNGFTNQTGTYAPDAILVVNH